MFSYYCYGGVSKRCARAGSDIEQLGRLARLGVQVVVVIQNTESASDYALIDEESLHPRPSYWAVRGPCG